MRLDEASGSSLFIAGTIALQPCCTAPVLGPGGKLSSHRHDGG